MSRSVSGVVVALAAAAWLAACGCEDDPRVPMGPLQTFMGVVEGAEADLPHYPKVWHRSGPADGWRPWEVTALVANRELEFEAREGDRYQVVSEDPTVLTPAMRRMFWMIDEEGVFGSAGPITIRMQPRTRVRVVAAASDLGVDIVTLAHEDGTYACAINQPVGKGLYESAWKGDDSSTFRRRAKNRPYVCDTFRPGQYVVGVQAQGHQWWVKRVDLEPGKTLEVDAAGQPRGGGTVICENGRAVLLVNEELPLPFPRTTDELLLRATWKGVPPGRHAIRYPDGKLRAFDVADGEEVTLPKMP